MDHNSKGATHRPWGDQELIILKSGRRSFSPSEVHCGNKRWIERSGALVCLGLAKSSRGSRAGYGIRRLCDLTSAFRSSLIAWHHHSKHSFQVSQTSSPSSLSLCPCGPIFLKRSSSNLVRLTTTHVTGLSWDTLLPESSPQPSAWGQDPHVNPQLLVGCLLHNMLSVCWVEWTNKMNPSGKIEFKHSKL